MEEQVFLNGDDISSYIISYNREKDLCSCESVLDIVLKSRLTIVPYDIITAHEDSILKGTFYVEATECSPDLTMKVSCRDNSKRANDYFIAEQIETIGVTTTRYWI